MSAPVNFGCMRCKFFDLLPSDGGEPVGLCRRSAPISLDTYGRGLWPVVGAVEWCGDGRMSGEAVPA